MNVSCTFPVVKLCLIRREANVNKGALQNSRCRPSYPMNKQNEAVAWSKVEEEPEEPVLFLVTPDSGIIDAVCRC